MEEGDEDVDDEDLMEGEQSKTNGQQYEYGEDGKIKTYNKAAKHVHFEEEEYGLEEEAEAEDVEKEFISKGLNFQTPHRLWARTNQVVIYAGCVPVPAEHLHSLR